MATGYGVRLAALTDWPARGATVKGAKAGAYRCAARLLQASGGLADIIATDDDDGVEWPEQNYRSVDVREYLGRDLGPGDVRALEAECRDALQDEAIVEEARVAVTFASGTIDVAADVVGSEGPFSFVLRITETDGPSLRVF